MRLAVNRVGLPVRKKRQKFVICAPSDNFVGLCLRN